MARRIFLDLDGVMADFDAHFPATFGIDHRTLADDDLWRTINAHPSYFRDMPPCPGATDFFAAIAHLDPIVLTACPSSNYRHVALQKREWVREHLSSDILVLPVMGGRNKPLFMHAPGDILIDDLRRNIDCWMADGGLGILHTKFPTTMISLVGALKMREDQDGMSFDLHACQHGTPSPDCPCGESCCREDVRAAAIGPLRAGMTELETYRAEKAEGVTTW